MPSNTFRSPFTSSFQSAVNRGTPASTAIANIAKRTNKSEKTIVTSLQKAGVVDSHKFNGQVIVWPTNVGKRSATSARLAQVEIFQGLVDWAIASGQTTPERLTNQSGSRQQFTAFVRRFFAKQVNASTSTDTTSKTRRGTTTRRSSSTRVKGSRRSTTRTSASQTIRFPSSRSSSTRGLRRAA